MHHDEREIRVDPQGEGLPPRVAAREAARDASIGELLKRLSTDTSELVRKEAELAKAEMREIASGLATDAAKVGTAVGLGLVGALALTTFLILALGNLLGGAFWLSALIVGLVAVGVGAMLVRSAVNDIRQRGFTPQQTIATLRADKEWARREAQEFKHEITTDR